MVFCSYLYLSNKIPFFTKLKFSSTNMASGGDDDNLDAVMQFQEVTGVEDVDVAMKELAEHDWSVEAAVHHHLALRDTTPTHSVAADSGSVSDYSGRSSRERSRSRGEDDHDGIVHAADNYSNENTLRRRGRGEASTSASAEERTTQAVFQRRGSWLWQLLAMSAGGVFGWFYYLMTLPLRVLMSSLSLFHQHRRSQDSLLDVVNFIRQYEEQYGSHHPAFFQGTYSQALNHAKAELKFLLVYLHCGQHQYTEAFCRTTLCSVDVVEHINSTMVFWGCDVTTAEGYRVSQALRENGYPFLALIVLRDNRMSVVGRIEGLQEPAQLLEQLHMLERHNQEYLILARAHREERELTAALRQEQDAAYQESLRADQEKARRQQQEQAEQQRQQEQTQRRLEEQKQQQQDLVRLRVDLAHKIPQEPPEGSDGTVHIVVKLPGGTRLQRRFWETDSLYCLYCYIFCHPDSPDRFEVTTNFPRQVVPCHPTADVPHPITFAEFSLPQRTMLFVTDLDA